MDGQYWKGDRTMSTNEWLLTSDFWQFLEPWHGRWYEYEIFIASCTDNIYHLENERWLLGDMIDHVEIYGSRVAEGLSAFNGGLVLFAIWLFKAMLYNSSRNRMLYSIVSLIHPTSYHDQIYSSTNSPYDVSSYKHVLWRFYTCIGINADTNIHKIGFRGTSNNLLAPVVRLQTQQIWLCVAYCSDTYFRDVPIFMWTNVCAFVFSLFYSI